MNGLDTRGEPDDGHRVEREIEEAPCADRHEHDVVPGDVIDANMAFACRVHDVPDEDDETHEHREARLGQARVEQGHANAINREKGHEHRYHDLGLALPNARVRLAVVLAHDLVDFRLGCSLRNLSGFSGGRGTVLEQLRQMRTIGVGRTHGSRIGRLDGLLS